MVRVNDERQRQRKREDIELIFILLHVGAFWSVLVRVSNNDTNKRKGKRRRKRMQVGKNESRERRSEQKTAEKGRKSEKLRGESYYNKIARERRLKKGRRIMKNARTDKEYSR